MLVLLKDLKYVGNVAKNISIRYFGENLRAVSVWGQIINQDEFNPKLDPVNILVVVDGESFDPLIVRSSLEFDYQEVLKARVDVFLSRPDILENMYTMGYYPYVLSIRNAFYAYGEEFLNNIKRRRYSCSIAAIDFALERAMIAFGMGLNDILRGELDIAVENMYNAIFNAAIAAIQKTTNHVPGSHREILELFESKKLAILRNMYENSLNIISKTIEAESSHVYSLDRPLETLTHFLRDNVLREVPICAYEILRESWRIVKEKELATWDRLIDILSHEIAKTEVANVEIRGLDPYPILRIKKVEEIKNIELKP